ncbi:MAG: response regulator [Spirochaetales bacterium]|nr:response regulator [Spirochaetales bacterium]MCF7939374.1 response regulator [Spirochaetales bacterium]
MTSKNTNEKSRILIVEDESVVALDLKNRLQRIGYEVIGHEKRGEDAVETAVHLRPDLVLMDIYLAGTMDGIEAAAAIGRSCSIPVVYVTAYTDDKTLERAKVTEAFGYIIKPYRERELQITIEMAIYKHELESKLEAERIWSESTLSAISDGVITADPDGYVRYMNPEASRLINKDLHDCLGEQLSSVLPLEDAGESQNGQDDVRVGNINTSRTSFPVEYSIRNIVDSNRAVIGSTTVFRDISGRLAYERELLKAKQAAEEASRVRSMFLSNISHELKTPLNSILGMSELLMESQQDSESREYHRIIYDSSHSLLNLINEILDFSRIEAGTMKIKMEPFEVEPMLEKSFEGVLLPAHRKGLDTLIDVDPDCPEQLIGDEGRIRQILTNLLNNAVKFTDAGMVRLSLDWKGDGLELVVSDTGIGIPPDKFEYIFQDFRQLDPSKTREYGGTGLGLSISRRIAEMMGGSISVESHTDGGSVFTVSLPLEAAKTTGKLGILPPVSGAEGSRVLIAVESRPIREQLQKYLRQWGATPEIYKAGKGTEKKSGNTGGADLCITDGEFIADRGTAFEKTDAPLVVVAQAGKVLPPELRRQGVCILIQPVKRRVLYQVIESVLTGESVSEAGGTVGNRWKTETPGAIIHRSKAAYLGLLTGGGNLWEDFSFEEFERVLLELKERYAGVKEVESPLFKLILLTRRKDNESLQKAINQLPGDFRNKLHG